MSLGDVIFASSSLHVVFSVGVGCTLLASCFFLYLLLKLSVCRSNLLDARGKVVPGPKSFFLGGNLKDMIKMVGKLGQANAKYMMEHDLDIMGLQIPPAKPIVMVRSLEGIKLILTGSYSKFPKDERYESMECVLGKGLVTSNGDMWKAHRALINPTFHAENLASMVQAFVKHTQELNEILTRKASSLSSEDGALGLSHDFHVLMTQLTGDIICDVAFGFQLNSKNLDSTPLGVALQDLLGEMRQRFNDPFKFVRYLPTERNRRYRRAKILIDGLVQQILRKRHEELLQPAPSSKRNRDLLDHLMSARDEHGHKLSDQVIVDQCFTFFGAGHETTANALTWTLYELGRNPDVMSKVQHEIDNVLQGRVPSFEDINKLDYTNLVLKESLRLHPPVAVVGRDINEDIELCGYSFSARQVCFVLNIFGLHRHPKLWTDPLKFIPERFDPKWPQYRKIDPHAYIPFSSGPRNCIGQRFAMFESIMILAMLLQKFEIRLQSLAEQEGVEAVTVRIKNGLPVWLRPRHSIIEQLI